jgi:hypothetical protein
MMKRYGPQPQRTYSLDIETYILSNVNIQCDKYYNRLRMRGCRTNETGTNKFY